MPDCFYDLCDADLESALVLLAKSSLFFQFGLARIELTEGDSTVHGRLETLIDNHVPAIVERLKSLFGLVGLVGDDFTPDLQEVQYILCLACSQARDEIHPELPSNFADAYPQVERVYDIEESPTESQVRQFESVIHGALVAFCSIVRVYTQVRVSDGINATRLCWESIFSNEAKFQVLQNYPAFLYQLNYFKEHVADFGSVLESCEISVSFSHFDFSNLI